MALYEFTNPQANSPNPLNVNCGLSAAVSLNLPGVSLRKVWFKLNSNEANLFSVTADPNSSAGSLTAEVFPCNLAARNKIEAKIEYDHQNGGTFETGWDQCRIFECSGSNYSCYYYGTGPASDCPDKSRMLNTVFPRNYRLSLKALGASLGPSFIAASGGLFQSNSIYLCYDVDASSPELAVWRSPAAPESHGAWVLRVYLKDCCLAADLAHQRLTPDKVLVPATFQSSLWIASGVNLLIAIPQSHKPNDPLSNAIVEIEPA